MSAPDYKIALAHSDTFIRVDDSIIGHSSHGVILVEGDAAPIVFIPHEDVAEVFLEPSDHRETCPWKGEARYFDLVTKDRVIENAAWQYDDPPPEAAAIKGLLTFDATRLYIEVI